MALFFSLRAIGLLLLTLLLTGCLALGGVDRRVITINKSVSKAQNTAILLDLIRASRNEPLYFMAMSKISGNASDDVKLMLPPFTVGPGRTASQRNFTFPSDILDNQTSTNFDVSVLGSKDFYSGLMAPLDLVDVNLLLHQGFSRELIFYLVIDRLTVRTPQSDKVQAIEVFNNDPSAPNYSKANNPAGHSFEDWIKEAMIHGVSTRTYTTIEPAGSNSGDSGDDRSKSGSKTVTHGALCYDASLAMPGMVQDLMNSRSSCFAPMTQATAPEESGKKPADHGGKKKNESEEGTELPVVLDGRQYFITVSTRSIFEIFSYLGRLMATDSTDRVRLRDYGLPAERIEEGPLFVIAKGGRDCFAKASYEDETFCVPAEGAASTKRIFSIIAALLALKTSPGDLPQTETVRLTP